MKPNANNETRPFGPFTNIPVDSVQDAGWECLHCKNPVEKLGQVMPGLVPRMMFYSCKCGSVICYEDEQQPDQKIWWNNIKLMRKTKTEVLLFNGNKETPEFQGRN